MDLNPDKRITKSDIIATLSDIDIKINDLHVRSTSDFMQLNEHLKDYHKKTIIISENAYRIFETISGGKDMDLIKELGNIQNIIEEYRGNIDNENSGRLKSLKEIILRSNRLNLILRNMRQDFTTLKFLSTNYCLLSNYNEAGIVSVSDIETWNTEVSFIHNSLIALSEQVDRFTEAIISAASALQAGIEKSVEMFRNLSEETNRNIDSITRKSKEAKLQLPLLKEKSSESSKCISDIITHLQYHDIIRQKIEHIQKSHYTIIEDLNHSADDNDEPCSPGNYIRIGDIIDLQAAQLLLVSKEYQKALNVITRNFQGIARDMTAISVISDKFSLENSSSGVTLLEQVRDQLDKGIVQLDMNDWIGTEPFSSSAGKKLEQLYEQVENKLKPKVAEFTGLSSIVNRFRFNAAGSGVLSQMISLNRDIEIKNHEISEYMLELANLSKEILGDDQTDIPANRFEIDRLQLMVRITKILDTLDRDTDELDKVLSQNRELNNRILSRIENVLNKSDYCEYFENIVGEVIGQLTDINNRIKPSSRNEVQVTIDENLREIRGNYTMESERIIHNMVVSGNEQTSSEMPGSENEIEFF